MRRRYDEQERDSYIWSIWFWNLNDWQNISVKWNYYFMDTDDYFWQAINPPYTKKRDASERLSMMKKDINEHEKIVIAGSLVDWGDELIPLFSLAIRVETDTDLRIERLVRREQLRFGNRIDIGGDMYENHQKFFGRRHMIMAV